MRSKTVILISISEITAFQSVSVSNELPKGSVFNLFFFFHCLLASLGRLRPPKRQCFQLVSLFSLPLGNPRLTTNSPKAVILACFLSCTAFSRQPPRDQPPHRQCASPPNAKNSGARGHRCPDSDIITCLLGNMASQAKQVVGFLSCF